MNEDLSVRDELAELDERLCTGGPGNSFDELSSCLRRLVGNREHTAAETLLRESRDERSGD